MRALLLSLVTLAAGCHHDDGIPIDVRRVVTPDGGRGYQVLTTEADDEGHSRFVANSTYALASSDMGKRHFLLVECKPSADR